MPAGFRNRCLFVAVGVEARVRGRTQQECRLSVLLAPSWHREPPGTTADLFHGEISRDIDGLARK